MRSTATSPVHERIDTKLFMTVSAVFLGALGLMGVILPEELLTYFGAAPDPVVVVFVSLAGSLYVGFAMLNWMARDNVIGGIYSRPVALANFVQFFSVAILLIKNLTAAGHPTLFGIGFVVNALFASFFGYLLFAKGKACA